MDYRTELFKIEKAFDSNSKTDDRFDALKAEKELAAFRRRLNRQKRTAEFFEMYTNRMMKWIDRFERKTVNSF